MVKITAQKEQFRQTSQWDTRSVSTYWDTSKLPQGTDSLQILGVDYVHFKTRKKGDLYLTKYGYPFIEQLKPESWFERTWFEKNREKLFGTSTVYRVKTKKIHGLSINIVVKWCRVGTDVPLDTLTLNRFANAEFNTPYEEFSLVTEMREQKRFGYIRTHKPLAIFVPSERLKIWQTGRSKSKIASKKEKYRDVELDIYRQYIMIYEWIKGESAVEALEKTIKDSKNRDERLAELTNTVIGQLAEKGYRVLDMKPAHIIVRPQSDGTILGQRRKKFIYALVDFELLERTPEHDEKVKASRRAEYFRRQEKRFFILSNKNFPKHLHHINIFGVDYIYGSTESTHGVLWVAGNDPNLFDYFLPERWRRTPRQRLSQYNQIYHTKTKDNIHLVWKVSRMGEIPEADAAVSYGYNSPFEEFAYALELTHLGIRTIYPRAIYMTGNPSEDAPYIHDKNRYETHGHIKLNDGQPLLRQEHNYITLWGHWIGTNAILPNEDVADCQAVSVFEAFKNGIINEEVYNVLIEWKRQRLLSVGFEDLKMRGGHVLLSIRPDGSFIEGDDGMPNICLCNFELLRRVE
jgi:hypothetical protein